MPGTERSVRIPMADGVELAANLYLPDTADPQPCLLEALPYRKDDLTSTGYISGYRTLRDDHGYAVCRVDLRGTGSCLLYTSPSPRDGLLSRMPSSA